MDIIVGAIGLFVFFILLPLAFARAAQRAAKFNLKDGPVLIVDEMIDILVESVKWLLRKARRS